MKEGFVSNTENLHSNETFSGRGQENISGVPGENFEGNVKLPSFDSDKVREPDPVSMINKPVIKENETLTPLKQELPSFDDFWEKQETPEKNAPLEQTRTSRDASTETMDVPNSENMEKDPIKQIDSNETENVEKKNDGSDYPSTYEERVKYTPAEGERGHWDGERGESKYTPTDPDIQETLDKYGMDGIEYKDGIPDFSGCSEATVEIDNMTTNRNVGEDSNFAQADQKCAEKWNQEKRDGRDDWTARDVANWRRENHYSWHECNDMKTCQLVPTEINDYFGHLGGVGECNRAGRIGDTNKKQEVSFDE